MRSAASASSGSRATISDHASVSGTGSTKRVRSQSRKATSAKPGVVRAVVSSVKRTACSSSQSCSSGVGSTSQASSANGTRSPSLTTAGIEVLKATSPKRLRTRSAWSRLRASGGVAVRPEDARVRHRAEDLGQQPAPDLEQVVALVEHEQEALGLLERLAGGGGR